MLALPKKAIRDDESILLFLAIPIYVVFTKILIVYISRRKIFEASLYLNLITQ